MTETDLAGKAHQQVQTDNRSGDNGHLDGQFIVKRVAQKSRKNTQN